MHFLTPPPLWNKFAIYHIFALKVIYTQGVPTTNMKLKVELFRKVPAGDEDDGDDDDDSDEEDSSDSDNDEILADAEFKKCCDQASLTSLLQCTFPLWKLPPQLDGLSGFRLFF